MTRRPRTTGIPSLSIPVCRCGDPTPAGLGRLFAQLLELLALLVRHRLGDERGLEAALDRLLRHHALGNVAARRQLELDVEEGLLEDRAQPAGAGLALQRAVRNRSERFLLELELDL